jgi:hypothetical protein
MDLPAPPPLRTNAQILRVAQDDILANRQNSAIETN